MEPHNFYRARPSEEIIVMNSQGNCRESTPRSPKNRSKTHNRVNSWERMDDKLEVNERRPRNKSFVSIQMDNLLSKETTSKTQTENSAKNEESKRTSVTNKMIGYLKKNAQTQDMDKAINGAKDESSSKLDLMATKNSESTRKASGGSDYTRDNSRSSDCDVQKAMSGDDGRSEEGSEDKTMKQALMSFFKKPHRAAPPIPSQDPTNSGIQKVTTKNSKQSTQRNSANMSLYSIVSIEDPDFESTHKGEKSHHSFSLPRSSTIREFSERHRQKSYSETNHDQQNISTITRRFSSLFRGAMKEPECAVIGTRERRSSMSSQGYGKSQTYDKVRKLGEGTYSVVYIGRSKLHKGFVAMKELKWEIDEGTPSTAIREVSLLRQLKHPNVVALLDVVSTDASLTLVLEYMSFNLRQIMNLAHGPLPLDDAKIFAYQLLQGMAFCHRKKIVHRDLKPENILISKTGTLKIGDFGLAREQTIPTLTYSSEVVTLWYRPPDVLLGATKYGADIDVWSIGTIIGEMLRGNPLFAGKDTLSQIQSIVSIVGNISEDTLPGCELLPNYNLSHHFNRNLVTKQLSELFPGAPKAMVYHIKKMLMYNPQKRITCIEAMNDDIYLRVLSYMTESPSMPGVKILSSQKKHVYKFFMDLEKLSEINASS